MQSFSTVPAVQPVQPLFPQHDAAPSSVSIAVAVELSALFERLGIQATICDTDGVPLANTPGAATLLGDTALNARRAVEVKMLGHRLCVSIPADAPAGVALDLTPRQKAVVELIAQGLKNREIAAELGISLHTVRRHVEGLLRRLNVPTRAAAAVLLRQALAASRHSARGPRRVA